MVATLSVREVPMGTMRPTDQQLAWSFGFCDGFAQWMGTSEGEDFILFISIVFERVFGTVGLTHFKTIALDQDHFADDIFAGGSAHHRWSVDGTVPLMPRA